MTPLEVRGEGITARLTVDGAALAAIVPAPALPDVSRLPGASVVGVASHEADGQRVVLGCVRAPSAKWVPGLQTVVFERATPMILGAASLRPTLERAPTPTVAGATFAEAHRARDGGRHIALVHALAFVGSDADAVACSIVCSAPDGASTCDAVASSFVLSGDLRPEPPPGLLARAVLATADHPIAALAIASSVTIAIVVLLLATRPRLRPTARARKRKHAAKT